MSYFVEACCPTLESVARAVANGASRIELCRDISCGGLTPSAQMIRQAIQAAGAVPVNVLVRPREGDFVYSAGEVEDMVRSIRQCKIFGVNGVVIGALTPEGDIDLEAMRILLKEAQPLHVTFHRAFDECRNPSQALEDIIGLGIERLLTSGHEADAYKGRYALQELVKQAAGRIVIMPGCGITPDNLDEIASVTGASEFHGTRLP